MNEQAEKSFRLLSLYERLCKGSELIKKKEVDRFDVSEKTIQRDFDTIRTYLSDDPKKKMELKYDCKKQVYRIVGSGDVWYTKEEMLAVGKVLLETRAFPKKEMELLLDKLIQQSAIEDRADVVKVICNERYHYQHLQYEHSLLQIIWDMSEAVRTKKYVNVFYKKENAKEPVKREIQPVGVLFSEYYFYLAAFQTKYDFEFPTIYRMDRITSYEVQSQHFKVDYANRFEEGKFREQIQFMQAGPLMDVTFRFFGSSLQAVLDRLPTAKIISQNETGAIIQAKVFGKGIKMWLLSQGPYVEVLKPVELREEMKSTIQKVLGYYT